MASFGLYADKGPFLRDTGRTRSPATAGPAQRDLDAFWVEIVALRQTLVNLARLARPGLSVGKPRAQGRPPSRIIVRSSTLPPSSRSLSSSSGRRHKLK